MNAEFISQLSDSVCWKLASALDRLEQPNWKTLVSKMPRNLYDDKAINRFYMAILKPFGSPTLELLSDLGKKKKRTTDLMNWLHEIGSFPELISIINSNDVMLENMAPIIERQPLSLVRCFVGDACSLSINVTASLNNSPPMFQWFREGIPLPNEVRSELSIVHTNLSHSGFYTCRVANDFGYLFTNWSRIEVIERPRDEIRNEVLAIDNFIEQNFIFRPPIITMHPRSVLIFTGETLRLTADVAGNPQPQVQWYYDDTIISGQCTCVLTIDNVNPDSHDGFYTLRATNRFGTVSSLAAQVIVNKARTTQARGPTHILSTVTMSSMAITEGPTDKVALLIGNQEYISQDTLFHPINDTLDLAAALMSIDFKVVSLINLDLTAMREALDFFYSIIAPGSYALFYFAGHGFEIGGKNYLMPIDATSSYEPSENLPLSDVLFAVTQKRAKLSVLLVDSCRTDPCTCYRNPMQSIMTHLSVIPNENVVERKNVVLGYGCCSRGRVLESPAMRNGYFVKYLVEFITRDIKVEDILYEVSKCINQERIVDPATGRMQIVYRQSTVVDDFKLTDEIVQTNETAEYSYAWQKAHVAPKSCQNVLSNEKLKIDLIFTAECSNCLLIQAKVTKLTTVDFRLDFIMPQRIGGARVDVIRNETDKIGKIVRIANLEKLEGDIEINMVIKIDGDEKFALYRIKEKPLYAKVIEAFKQLGS